MGPSSAESQVPVLDVQDLTDRCLGNLALLERIVAKFESHFDHDMALLEAAVLSHDSQAVAGVAHRLKGASANVSAPGLCARAAGVEKLAREGRLAGIGTALEELRSERLRFSETIVSIGGELLAADAGAGVCSVSPSGERAL
jgi:HPt (histidine-containing phosphotransfer) domain-containing protein